MLSIVHLLINDAFAFHRTGIAQFRLLDDCAAHRVPQLLLFENGLVEEEAAVFLVWRQYQLRVCLLEREPADKDRLRAASLSPPGREDRRLVLLPMRQKQWLFGFLSE